MRVSTSIIFLSLVSFTYSCNERGDNAGLTSLDTVLKTYYPNGNLKAEVAYKNLKRNGIEKNYYENGQLEEIGNNLNDLEDSTWLSYFPNGSIEEVVNYKNGRVIGEAFYYYRNKQVEKFIFNDEKGAVYIRDYDSLGNFIKDHGFPILLFANKYNLSVNEKFEIQILLGMLPHWDINLIVTDLSNSPKDTIERITNASELYRGYYGKGVAVSKEYDRIGNYKWEIYIDILDTKENKKINFRNTISFSYK